jgi:hypothetical protein
MTFAGFFFLQKKRRKTRKHQYNLFWLYAPSMNAKNKEFFLLSAFKKKIFFAHWA